jgi:hypothetical protein
VSTGVWRYQGIAIPPNTADLNGGNPASGTEEPTVLYDSNPQLISPNGDGKVFKMWFAGGNDIYYAESNAGLTNWTRYGSKIFTNQGHPRVFKDGSTYYMSYSVQLGPPWNIQLASSSDGITWVNYQTNMLTPGGVGTWDHAGVFHAFIWKEAANDWRTIYDGSADTGNTGSYFAGYATSSDGHTWSKQNGGNPVISLAPRTSAGSYVAKVSGTYYAWQQCLRGNSSFQQIWQEPDDIYRFQSTDLINWTLSPTSATYSRQTADE